MCGIIGFSGDFSPDQLKQGTDRLRHRGPDDIGHFYSSEAKVGLGHTRLSIQDLSASGHQPMIAPDGSVVLVFNGEIYNFQELREELRESGYVFTGRSDTEVLLNLYISEGEAMLSRLNGIFAFALWDRRTSSVFVARDGLGVKPLYFSETSRGVVFASEIKALVPLLPDRLEIDPLALHRYLSFLWCPGEGTPVRNVRKLGPGECIRLRDGKLTDRRQWYVLPAAKDVMAKLSREEAISGTLRHLRTAVHRQLVADVPVGAFLSGGLDSSAVVALARERHQDIHCFTIKNSGGQDRGFVDDLPYATCVARHLGVKLEIVEVNASHIATDLQRMVEQLDEPLVDTAPLNVFYISRLARERGIKVLLSGTAGDDLFSGYRRHLALRYERFWNWLPDPVLDCLENGSAKMDQKKPFFRRLARLLSGASLQGDERISNHFLWIRERELMQLYTPDFRGHLTGNRAVGPLVDFLAPLPPSVSELSRMLLLEQRFFLADFNLPFTDKMSMAAGVEVRVPFLDLELVDFAARIPDHFKQRGREGKWVLKKAMEPYLPREIIYRPKTGFGGPLRRWMRHELRPLLRDTLAEASLRKRGFFDPGAVQSLIERDEAGEVDGAYLLLSLMCIEIWCRSFLD